MKILIISQYYSPENLPINFIINLLNENNVKTDILTGKPNYPEGKFFRGHSIFSKIKTIEDNKIIYRVPILPRGRGRFRGIKLGMNYISFVISARFFSKIYLKDESYDYIFVYANSPLLKTIPAISIGKRKKIPVILWVQDLWPESFEASGFKLPILIKKYIRKTIKNIYQDVTIIACQSRGFIEKIHNDFSVPYHKLFYLPNTVDKLFLNPNNLESSLNLGKKIPSNNQLSFDIFFTGNIGEAQSIDTVLEAAKILDKINSNIRFIIIGDGSKLKSLKKLALNYSLKNIFFLGAFPLQEIPYLLKSSSALLITLKNHPAFNLTIPNKLQSYYAFGKPIIGSISGEASKDIVTSGAGLVCEPECPEALAQTCLKIAKMEDKKIYEMSVNAKLYFEKKYSNKIFIDNFYSATVQATKLFSQNK